MLLLLGGDAPHSIDTALFSQDDDEDDDVVVVVVVAVVVVVVCACGCACVFCSFLECVPHLSPCWFLCAKEVTVLYMYTVPCARTHAYPRLG